MKENRGYTQRYAMIFGTYMGVFWILKFVLFPLGLMVPFLSFLFVGLTLCVPFMGYYYARSFRNQVCGGAIGLMQAFAFAVLMYMFASLLTAVAHYVYFRFIDGGFILDTCEAQIRQVAQSGIPGIEAYTDMYSETLQVMRALNPLEITLQLISTNFFVGIMLALPTALLVMKRRPMTGEPRQENE
ncbi:MAG: DUF4199 domain-containing protein [Bacteroides sp.]|nr:DUF4199 domain-containing protein [Bacteroides sp.]